MLGEKKFVFIKTHQVVAQLLSNKKMPSKMEGGFFVHFVKILVTAEAMANLPKVNINLSSQIDSNYQLRQSPSDALLSCCNPVTLKLG